MSADDKQPLLICYDGSEDAKCAVERAGKLFAPRPVIVLTVWQPTSSIGSFAWSGAMTPMVDFVALDREVVEAAEGCAAEGVSLANSVGLQAEAKTIRAPEAVWETIIACSTEYGAAAVVMGTRGLTGVRSFLLGSVSAAVLHHATCPTLVVHRDRPPEA